MLPHPEPQSQPPPNIDKNALSRQLAVYGAETQGKLMALRVFIIGLRGVGIEVAKNLALAGPKKVALYDPTPVRVEDLGSNFFLTQAHVGKLTRAEASLEQLKNLNPHVQITIEPTNVPNQVIGNYDCVVVTDTYDKKYLLQLNHICRERKIGFIYAGNLGLYGFTFVDFGDEHKCHDQNGEETKSAIIVGITKDKDGLVYSHEDKRHGFEDGDWVTFKEVKGMEEVNGKLWKVVVKSPHTFSIGDTSGFGEYEMNGRAEQVKVPVVFKFNSLEKSLANPFAPERKELDLCSWDKIGRAEELHVILNGLLNFHEVEGRLPNSLDEGDADKLVKVVAEYLEGQKTTMETEGEFKVDKVDEELVKNIARYANTQISPTASFWGGIICQEIVKLTGKYTPLRQWLHHDFLEILPSTAVTRTLTFTRYSDYTTLFGTEFLSAAHNVNTFLIGAGALGCQFIKMFSLMGIGTKGTITVTDDDNIEISNLNRQFLFRKQNVGGNKSEVACAAGKKMNPEVNFNPLKLRVDPDNQITFDDQFWDNLSFVVNAVDNVKARLYVDSRCVWYEKVLFESGTLGTKCNSQVVVPKFTQSYGDSEDPAEETIPLCTLKNFPYQIEHTIQWARDYFEGLFVDGPQEAARFCENPKEYLEKATLENKKKLNLLKTKLQTVSRLVKYQQQNTYQACVELAKNIFEEVLFNQISQLIHSLPIDHKSTNGKPFWSGLKRFPDPIHFDSNDQRHIELLQAIANIFAHIFGLPQQQDAKIVAGIADSIQLPEFQPRRMVIQIDDQKDKNKKEEPEEKDEEDETVIQRLQTELMEHPLLNTSKWNLIEFQKDDPTNFHIEFVAGIANLRARNYNIEEVDNFKVKLIAGKIIPAIATTTAMIVGAVGIEILKKILNHPPELYKNSFISLALPLWVFSDPLPPVINEDKQYDDEFLGPSKMIPPKFTNWEKIDVKGPMTVSDLIKFISAKYSVSVSLLEIDPTHFLFNKYQPKDNHKLELNVAEAYEKVTGKEISKYQKYLRFKLDGETLEGVDARFPKIKYQI